MICVGGFSTGAAALRQQGFGEELETLQLDRTAVPEAEMTSD